VPWYLGLELEKRRIVIGNIGLHTLCNANDNTKLRKESDGVNFEVKVKEAVTANQLDAFEAFVLRVQWEPHL
jgi:hypothetical protein